MLVILVAAQSGDYHKEFEQNGELYDNDRNVEQEKLDEAEKPEDQKVK